MLRRLLVLAIVLAPTLAGARSESKLMAYARDQVWPTAVRFIAVDTRAKILDKDADTGYVLFEIRDDGKVYRGSLEIVTHKSDGVRFVISLVDQPSWMEIALLTKLEDKVRAELGSPNPPKPKPEPPKEPDRDKDKKPDGLPSTPP